MTSSTNPFQIIDEDDDGFDWEAAVREIDDACQAKALATSASEITSDPQLPHSYKATLGETDKKFGGGSCSKQSTLDKFMIKACPEENPSAAVNGQQHDANASNRADDERPSCVAIDAEAAKSWLYPVNVPCRDYQFSITKTALFSNTLVALPTGLGKTLIAAVVMYNYFRWFPQGKIVFAAPSRPLVIQQIEACHNIVGIPQEWTIEMTGQLNPTRRASFWKEKRVFFVTPQVLEKDIQSGTCMVKHLVCLVIDEAHRATGNYSYCVIVRELMAVSVQLRILALSATPGTNLKTIQQIIDNLCISTIEYREESDDDVSKFVHNRKIELIQVAMGQDAVDCDNMLVELISPYAKRLRSLGLLHSRELRNISPPELLSMRDKFRQAPPDISHLKNAADVEGHFGLLLTFCHIRKLLSSHGVKPAYEMLEDKLQQGSLKRYMSRNEVMQKLKLLMQKSLSNGAFTPKLSKMLEVLADHFSTKDPKCSRVIIFSNFRGSVREIMDSLVNIGEHVKATEFIGQSSGKSLKGQSQKVQQAVLEKFRAGGYNVIVATSIGEEGLDIMEVDLVICFDANISSLRMIQRMGRTGRKSDGRVVVLACEGSELKGYFKKQAGGKVVKKHMQNEGLQSFTFYPSPRMVPHIFKPEAHFVKLSIEEYVPRTKKLMDHHSFQTPNVAEKLTDSEAHLLAKYFKPNGDNTWKPSLIAFPHFQAYPSRIHRVMHSLRTRILIDAVQSLQENSPFPTKIFIEDQAVSSPCLKEAHVCNIEGSPCSNDSLKEDFEAGVSDSTLLTTSTIYANDMHKISKSQRQRSVDHCHLFSSKFVSVDTQGKVQILLVPIIPDKQTSTCRSSESSKTLPAHFLDQSFSPGTPKLKNEFPDEAEGVEETLMQVPSYNVKDTELSPRLTRFIRSGVVPESPMDGHGLLSPEECFESPKSTSQSAKKRLMVGTTITVREASNSPVEEASTHLVEKTYRNGKYASPIAEETRILSANMESQSCSKDWCLTSGNKIASGEKPRDLKRLRRHGDICGRSNRNNVKENSNIHKRNLITSSTGPSLITAIHSRDEQEPDFNVRDFIEEEPEVSSGAIVSDDEELQEESSSYESSFIDDRINLTSPGTQAEVGSVDMMGIYRRSLLSQSPIVTSTSPQPAALRNRTGNTGSFLDKSASSLRTLEAESGNTRYAGNLASYPHRSCSSITPSGARPFSVTLSSEESNGFENRKRKVSCTELGSVPAVNLEERFIALSEADQGAALPANGHAEKVDVSGNFSGKQTSIAGQSENTRMDGEMCDDDDSFYASLNLDAVEAQATMLLKNKSQVSVQREELICKTIPRYDLIGSPSFDLGI